MEQKEGNVIGGMLLIAGSCIGAGMLGLPIITGFAGFFPSLLMFFAAWIFMTTTGLLLIEVNGWFQKPVHLTTMVEKTLGIVGKILTLFLFLFLFYALLVAYVAGSGHHLSDLFHSRLPVWVGSFFFVVVFGIVVYFGTRAVDMTNRWLMALKIIAYFGLVFIGFKFLHGKKLLYTDFKYSFFPLPVLIISFGFHNMIPSLTNYFNGNIKKVRQSIIGGSLFTLGIYLLWQIVALGILPIKGSNSIVNGYKEGVDAAQLLGRVLQHSIIGDFAFALAFFAILTSFLAQALSLVHFLADSFKVETKQRENIGLCILALLPPLILAISNPNIFFAALNFAGGICAVILFGVFPALMVYIGRYKQHMTSDYQVRGGKPVLFLILGFAIFVFLYQLSNTLGFSLFPKP
ncbi:MAG: tyrosine transporter [Chlamydiales bacterium]|nr:tyrosine transporter [Chlamydiales bacterium]